jgi:hypothetical protein
MDLRARAMAAAGLHRRHQNYRPDLHRSADWAVSPRKRVVRQGVNEGHRRILALLSALFVGLVMLTGVIDAAADYDHRNLADQLGAQKVTMPTAPAVAGMAPAGVAALTPYLGQPMTTGAQAEAYADH